MKQQKQSNRLLGDEVFPARLPYPTVPTNLSGVFATAPLPAAFDPKTASDRELLRHGLLWPRPKAGEDGVVRRAWERAFSKPWLAENNIVPEMEIVKGRTHRKRPVLVKETVKLSNNWSGGEVVGAFNAVSAFWDVPKVSKPTEKHGKDGGWNSGSWIGIGGDPVATGADNLLQAGVLQYVSGNGDATYVAFYEWITDFMRVTLGDRTPSNYALASRDDGFLFLAYRGENNSVDVKFSIDNGNTFPNEYTSKQNSSYGPALAVHFGVMVVAWAGHGNNQLNFAFVDIAGANAAFSNQVITGWKSVGSPALASFNGILWVAWRDSTDRLNIGSSTDGGHTFGQQFVSNETSPQAPTLTVHDGRLLIGWKGDGNDWLNVATVETNGGTATGIVNKVIIESETTPLSPSLASLNGALFLSWRGDGNSYLNVMQSTDGGKTFTDKFTSPIEKSPSSPTLAVHNGHLFIGWRGENDGVDLGVVGIVNGEIVGFGPNQPYYYEINIKNFPVKAGDSMVCAIICAPDLSFGNISMGNMTTGKHFSISLQPPMTAETVGGSIEWIMEAPWIGGQTVIPKFTPLVFTDAFGCGTGGLGDPQNGESYILTNMAGDEVTSAALAKEQVTVNFTG